MRAVVDAGADLMRRDKQGCTPPAIAQLAGRKQLLEIMSAPQSR